MINSGTRWRCYDFWVKQRSKTQGWKIAGGGLQSRFTALVQIVSLSIRRSISLCLPFSLCKYPTSCLGCCCCCYYW